MADKSFWREKKDKNWISNFFFYYSKHLIFFCLLTALIVYGCFSCSKKIDYDLEIYYMGEQYLSLEAFDNVEKEFANVIDDLDGKDGITVSFNDYTIVSGNDDTAERDMVMVLKINSEVAEGEGYLYFMNDDWLKFCMDNEVLEDISKYTGDSEPCYFMEINDNTLLNNLGVITDGNLYVGVRILNDNRKDNEIQINKYNNAIKALKYIIENK